MINPKQLLQTLKEGLISRETFDVLKDEYNEEVRRR